MDATQTEPQSDLLSWHKIFFFFFEPLMFDCCFQLCWTRAGLPLVVDGLEIKGSDLLDWAQGGFTINRKTNHGWFLPSAGNDYIIAGNKDTRIVEMFKPRWHARNLRGNFCMETSLQKNPCRMEYSRRWRRSTSVCLRATNQTCTTPTGLKWTVRHHSDSFVLKENIRQVRK